MEITDITRESDDAVQEMVVTMTASADEVNTYIEQQFKELAKNEIPGFRKGKAPREVIERGAELCGLTLEELWQQTLDAMRSCEDSINRQMEEI